MFCSNCSQKITSDNIRFCSRCGFRLSAVKSLFGDDNITSSRDNEPHSYGKWLRKKDMTIGAVLMFFMAWRSVWATEDLSFESKVTGLMLNCFILAVLVNVIPFILDYFRRSSSRKNENSMPESFFESAARFNGSNHNFALPAYDITASEHFTNGTKTAEITAPPSVTIDTTELLNRNLK